MDPKQNDPSTPVETNEEAPLTREAVQAMVNGALGAHTKRTTQSIKESIAAALAEFKPARTEESDATSPDAKGKLGTVADSPEYRELKKRLEASEKKQQQAEEERRKEVEARRNDSARASLRKSLEANGVRPEALDVLVDAMAGNGTLRFDEDGRPQVAVKRSRSKGGPVEEQLFDDFEQAVSDWKQRPDAAVFLKPVATKTPPIQKRPLGPSPTGRLQVPGVAPTENVDAITDQILGRLSANQDG